VADNLFRIRKKSTLPLPLLNSGEVPLPLDEASAGHRLVAANILRFRRKSLLPLPLRVQHGEVDRAAIAAELANLNKLDNLKQNRTEGSNDPSTGTSIEGAAWTREGQMAHPSGTSIEEAA
jgi:hypothetical protein